MESIEGNTLLLTVNFPSTTINFTLGASRSRPEEFQRWIRNPKEDSQRQIILTLMLEGESLITHTAIHCSQLNLIQFIRVQAAGLSDSTQFNTMVNIHPIQQVKQQTGIITSNIGYTKIIRLTFLLKQNNQGELLKEHSIKFQKKSLQNAFDLLFQKLISKIEVWGHQSNCSPPASMISPLLNLSTLFKKYCRQQESQQVDVLLGLCLVNARRFTQATQHLKKVSQNYIKRYNSFKNLQINSNPVQKQQSQIKNYKHTESDIFFFNSSTGQNLINSSSKKLLFRAAKVQLLIAESINQPIMTNQKIKAYYRAASYSSGIIPKIDLEMKQYDIYTILLEISPSLIRLLLKTLQDRFEPLKLTSIKSLQFLLQIVGCSVGNFLPQILKSIIHNYPKEDSILNKQTIDHYHHLIQTYINLLNTLSKNICRSIFQQVIIETLFHSQISPQIRIYLIRIADRLITLCSADLDIPINFMQGLLKLIQSKVQYKMGFSKQKQSILNYHSQKLYQSIKTKVISQISGPRLQKYSQWINQILLLLCEQQITQVDIISLNNVLDLINVIYLQPTYSVYPIQAVLYFLDSSLSQTSLPFDKILYTFGNLLRLVGNHNIVIEIIQKIMTKSKVSNLTIKQIKVLIEMMSIHRECEQEWLQQFLKCIPHSTFDEVFTLFDIMLVNFQFKLSASLIKLVINTLLDQYTVKGKAYKKTKQLFLSLILTQNPSTSDHFFNFMSVCLLKNNFPSSQQKQINRLKVRKFDSKLYLKQVQLFSQKLVFVCEILQSIDLSHLQKLLQTQTMEKFKNSLILLLSNNNSKIRMKGISIISSILDCFQKYNPKIINEKRLLLSKTFLAILRCSLQLFRDSRLQFNLLFFVLRIFDYVLIAKNSNIKKIQQINQCDLDLLDLTKPIKFEIDDPFYLTLRVRQVIKLWSSVIPYIGSPWVFNKDISLVLLSSFFSIDIDCYRNTYSKKLCQLVLPVISNLFQSAEWQDRYYGLKLFATVNQLIYLQKQNIQKGCNKLKQVFPQVLGLSSDWNPKVRDISNAIVLVGFDKHTKNQLARNKSQIAQNNSINNLILNSFFSEQFQQQGRSYSQTFVNLSQNIENFLKQTQNMQLQEQSLWLEERKEQSKFQFQRSTLQASLDSTLKILEQLGKDERESLSEWNQKNLSNQIVQVFQQDNLFSMIDESIPSLNMGTAIRKKVDEDQEHLDFEDLGIIEVDDQQWNDYQNQMTVASSNLLIKRKYKLSPNIGNPNKIDLPLPIAITHTQKLPVSPSKFQQKSEQLQSSKKVEDSQQQQLQKIEVSQQLIRQQKSSEEVSYEDLMTSQQKQPQKQVKIKPVKKKKKELPKIIEKIEQTNGSQIGRKSSASKKKKSIVKSVK